ncbi:stage III sporulation AC/AD family protein [Niameybacter massiliensis]|uniref:Stage III sporulation AC/AD family protein n=1 Tax=Holtiella tumoricola TaxID=3018743 RepID=A0AA42J2J4_9FIRM|nr:MULTISPECIES: stage III sporulation AC/AD family protein [Lachnospirales]MDA3733774.1 stage III sporulation AC/AD family protein [Holtiella tumoricola]
MDQMMELLKIGGLSMAVMFMSIILKQAGKDSYANMVSIGGITLILLIIASYILQLFEVVETMFMF